MRIELSLMVFIAAAAAAADLSIYPPAITLWGQKATQVVAVTRLDVDGVHRDVTAECHLSVDDATVASVSKGGVILSVGNGTTTLHAVHKDLTAQIKVTTSSTGARPKVSFVKDVLPLFTMSGCANANCHGSIRGQRGFKLSLFGYDPPFDFEAITGGDGHRIDRRDPAKSLILQKPTFQVPHGGGVRFAAGSLPYQTILEWLQDGAQFDASDSPRIQALSIFPEERILVGMGTTQQLIATARYTDGSSRDVTRLVQYGSNAPDFVQVGPTGIVKAIQPGETAVMIRTLGQSVAARILVASQPVSRDYPEIPRNNYVDNLVFAKLRRLNITPSPSADDITFLRRAYVDTIGLLPTEEETDRFLVSQDRNRRAKLIDELLQRPELADLWALKFTELFRAGTRESDTKGSRIIYEYLQRSFAANKPYDELVRELLLSQGPHYFSDGPSSFYNISFDSNPADNVTNVSQLFLGVRMECARCHNHPFEKWTQDDFYGFAAFFARVGVKELYENNENAG